MDAKHQEVKKQPKKKTKGKHRAKIFRAVKLCTFIDPPEIAGSTWESRKPLEGKIRRVHVISTTWFAACVETTREVPKKKWLVPIKDGKLLGYKPVRPRDVPTKMDMGMQIPQ